MKSKLGAGETWRAIARAVAMPAAAGMGAEMAGYGGTWCVNTACSSVHRSLRALWRCIHD